MPRCMPTTPRDLASAMRQLASSPELAARTARRVRWRAPREFSWERTARLTREVYEEARRRFGE